MRPGVEPGPRHRSVCRSAEVVVDDFHVDEPTLAGDLDEIILPPLALEIGHDLGLRGLATIRSRYG